MKKSNKILICIIGSLFILIMVLAYFNKNTLVEKTQMNNDAIFSVMLDGENIKDYTMDDIQKLGEESFNANLKTNGKESIPYEYTGVLLKKILEDADIDFENKESAIVSSIDGYVVAVSMKKVLDNNNVYLAYKREGEWLGTREEGGKGPYQMIISKDEFSQYWCKYAFSVEVN